MRNSSAEGVKFVAAGYLPRYERHYGESAEPSWTEGGLKDGCHDVLTGKSDRQLTIGRSLP